MSQIHPIQLQCSKPFGCNFTSSETGVYHGSPIINTPQLGMVCFFLVYHINTQDRIKALKATCQPSGRSFISTSVTSRATWSTLSGDDETTSCFRFFTSCPKSHVNKSNYNNSPKKVEKYTSLCWYCRTLHTCLSFSEVALENKSSSNSAENGGPGNLLHLRNHHSSGGAGGLRVEGRINRKVFFLPPKYRVVHKWGYPKMDGL